MLERKRNVLIFRPAYQLYRHFLSQGRIYEGPYVPPGITHTHGNSEKPIISTSAKVTNYCRQQKCLYHSYSQLDMSIIWYNLE